MCARVCVKLEQDLVMYPEINRHGLKDQIQRLQLLMNPASIWTRLMRTGGMVPNEHFGLFCKAYRGTRMEQCTSAMVAVFVCFSYTSKFYGIKLDCNVSEK